LKPGRPRKGAHRGAAMATTQTFHGGRHGGALWGVEGGWCARGVKKVCDGAKREEGVGSLGAPLVAGGTRGKRGMGGGPVGVRPREGGGGAGHGTRSSWGPRTRACAVGRRQPGDGGTVLRAGEAGEEREKGEGGGDR
jgi:hypothetical protein